MSEIMNEVEEEGAGWRYQPVFLSSGEVQCPFGLVEGRTCGRACGSGGGPEENRPAVAFSFDMDIASSYKRSIKNEASRRGTMPLSEEPLLTTAGDFLYDFRKRHGLTQSQLAALLDLPNPEAGGQVTISRWEAGTPPESDHFVALAMHELVRRIGTGERVPRLPPRGPVPVLWLLPLALAELERWIGKEKKECDHG